MSGAEPYKETKLRPSRLQGLRGTQTLLTRKRAGEIAGRHEDIRKGWQDVLRIFGVLLSLNLALPGLAFAATDPVESDFEDGVLQLDGWSAFGDISNPRWESSGGNPGGYFAVEEIASGDFAFYSAPGQFLGDQSNADGLALGFDIFSSTTSSTFTADDVVMEGGGLRLIYRHSFAPAPDGWTSYVIPLEPGPQWRVMDAADPWSGSNWGGLSSQPNSADFATVLADVDALYMRAEYWSGSSSLGLDNVILLLDDGSGVAPPDQVSAAWLGGDGAWGNASLWSSDPLTPINSLSQVFDVVIDASAPDYRVDLTNSVTVDSVLVNFSGAELLQSGGLFQPGSLNVANGTYRLEDGAILANADLALGAGGVFRTDSDASSRFSNVSLASDLSLVDDFGTITVDADFDLGGNTLTLFNRGSRIYIDEDLTLGSGTIFSDPTNGSTSRSLYLRNTDTQLTLGAGGTLRGGRLEMTRNGSGSRFFVNEGLVSADASGESIELDGSVQVTNTGTLEARDGGELRVENLQTNTGTLRTLTGGRLDILGDWSNSGAIENAGTLFLGGTFSDPGTLSGPGGTVVVNGVFDLGGGSYSIDDAIGTWRLDDGTLQNGSLTLSDPEKLRFTSSGGNRLSDIALQSDLRVVDDFGTLAVNGGFSLGGNTLTLFNRGSRIYIDEDLALGSGTIFSDPTNGSTSRFLYLRNTDTQLTLGAGGTLRGGRLEMTRNGSGSRFFVNEGLVSADASGESIELDGSVDVTNTGTLEARDGGELRVENLQTNTGTLRTLTGGRLDILGDWSNSGVIENAGTLFLGGTFSDPGTLSGPDGTVVVNGVFDLGGGSYLIDDTIGTWRLDDGTLRNGSLTLSDPEKLRFTSSGGNRLYDIALQSDLRVVDDFGTFAVNSGFSLGGNTLTFFNRGSRMYVDEDLTLGSGTIFSDPTNGSTSRFLYLRNTDTQLTLGAGGTLRGGRLEMTRNGSGSRFFVNEGLVSADASGERIELDGSVQVTNTGTLEARDGGELRVENLQTNTGTLRTLTGGRLDILGDWSNSGAIENAGTLFLGGTFSDPGTLSGPDGTVVVNGVFDLGGGSYLIDDAIGTWRLDDGTLQNGSLTLSDPEKLRFSGSSSNRLYDIALQSDLRMVDDFGRLSVNGGFSLEGNTLTLSHRGTSLFVDEDLTLADGTIFSDPQRGSSSRNIYLDNNDVTLTLGAGAVLHGGRFGMFRSGSGNRFFVNAGLVSADQSGERLELDQRVEVTNTGTLEARNGGELRVENLAANSGLIEVLAGSSVLLEGEWTNTGTIDATDGSLTLRGDWNNAGGTINLGDTAFDLGGSHIPGDLGTITRTGGSFTLSGTLDLAGGSYTIDESLGPWTLDDGTIRNGSLTLSDPEKLRFSGSSSNRLYDIALQSDLRMVDDFGRFSVNGGFSLEGNTLTLSHRGTSLFVDENLTLANGTIFSDPQRGSSPRNIYLDNNDVTLTLGAGAVLHGGRFGMFRSGSGNRFFVNAGLVSADQSGERLELDQRVEVTNTGTLEARNGGELRVENLAANSGLIEVLAGSSVLLEGEWTNTGTIDATDGSLTLRGDWNNAGGTINLGDTAFDLGGSHIPGDLGTITRTGGSFTLSGTLDLAGGSYTIDESLGPWTMDDGTLRNGSLTLSDPEKLRFSGSSSNRLYDIALQSDLRMVDDFGRFSVNGGFSLEGNTLTLSHRGTSLFVDEDLTLADGTIFSDPQRGSSPRNIYLDNNDVTLTLGAGAVLHGGRFGMFRSGSGNRFFVNAGLVSADQSGERLELDQRVEVTNTGTLEARNGGELRVENLVSNSGVLSVLAGSSIVIEGNLATGAETGFEVGASGGPVPLQVSGDAALGGMLTVEVSDDYVPELGDSFVILEANSLSGGFDSVDLPQADGLPVFDLTVGATQVELTVAERAPVAVDGPFPADGAGNIVINPDLNWQPSGFSDTYAVFLGTSASLGAGDQIGTTSDTQFSPNVLGWGTQYFWRVDAVNPFGTTQGPVWSFTTRAEPDPDAATIWVAGDGNWSGGANWSSAPNFPQNGSPTSGDSYSVLIDATGEYTIVIDQDITIDQLVIDAPGARVLHTGGTLTVLDDFEIRDGVYEQSGGRLADASVTVGVDGVWEIAASSTLRDVTLGPNLELTIPNGQLLSVEGDLTLDDSTIRLASSGTVTRLRFDGGEPQTLDGDGAVVFDGTGSDSSNRIESWGSGTHLSIGSGVTVRAGTGGGWIGVSESVTNAGTIRSAVDGRSITINPNVAFENTGALEVAGGGELVIESLQGDLNASAVSIAGSGSRLSVSGDFVIDQDLTIPADTELLLGGRWTSNAVLSANNAQLTFAGDWSNSGTLNLTGAALDLGGDFAFADLGTFNRTSGTVRLSGTLENSAKTLLINADTGDWDLDGGRIVGGTLAFADGAQLRVVGSGVFENLTLNASVDLTVGNGAFLSVDGDLTLDDAILRLAASGSIARVRFDDGGVQTLDGTGQVVFDGSGSDSDNRIESWGGGTHLFVGPNVTVRSGTRGGYLGVSEEVTNQGTLRSGTAGRTITVNPNSNFNNEGTLIAENGGDLALESIAVNTGTLSADAGSRILIDGDAPIGSALTLRVGGPAASDWGQVNASGELSLSGDFELSFANGYLPETGERYDLISANTVTGTFDAVALPDVDNDISPAIIYAAAAVDVLVSGSPPAQVTDPTPEDGATNRSLNQFIAWSSDGLASSFDVYFGTDPAPDTAEFVGNQVGTSYDPGELSYGTTYFWRVDALNQNGSTTGPVWSFTTRPEPASLAGVVWHDENTDDVVDAGEALLEGWEVYLDLNENGVRNSGEPRRITDANGAYIFEDIMPGEYNVRQTVQNTWAQSFPANGAAQVQTLTPGQALGSVNFGNVRTGPIVQAASLSESTPVPATDALTVSVRFDRSMDTAISPTLELVPQDGQSVPTIPGGGDWSTGQREDDTYESPPVTTQPGMDGSFILRITGATDPGGRVGDPAEPLTFEVDATPPPVVDIEVTEVTPTSLTVGWNDYSAPADLNLFRIYLEDEAFDTVVDLSAFAGSGASARSYTFTGLELDREYHVAVGAVDAVLNTERAIDSIPVEIESQVPPALVPDLSRPELGVADLGWSHYDSDTLIGFAGYRIYVEESDFTAVDTLTPVATAGPEETGLALEGLDRSKEFYIAVVPYNRLGEFVNNVETVLWRDRLSEAITEDFTLGGEGSVIDVAEPLVVQAGAELTLPAGTTLRFAPGSGLTIEDGALRALGTAEAPVQLTAQTESGRGNWTGVVLKAAAAASELRHTWIRHGGGLRLEGTNGPALDHLRLVWNEPAGLAVTSGAVAGLANNFIALNQTGVWVDATSSLTISQSVIKNNAVENATAATGGTLNADQNWWGLENPVDIGGTVSGPVTLGTPLAGEPVLGPFAGFDGGAQTGTRGIGLTLNSANGLAYRVSEDSTFDGVFFADVATDAPASELYRSAPFEAPVMLSDGGGLKTLFVEFRSATGEVTAPPLEVEVEYVTEGPEINAFNLNEGDEFSRPVEISATAEAELGLEAIEFYADGELILSDTASPLAGTWDFRGEPEGIVRVRIEARDTAGRIAVRELNVRLSPEPPAAPVITAPSGGSFVADPVFDLSGTAEAGISVRVTRNDSVLGTSVTAPDGTFAFEDLTLVEGANALVATAFDAAGSSASDPVVVNLSTVPPAPLEIESAQYVSGRGLEVEWRFPDSGKRAEQFRVLWHDAPFSDTSEASGQSDLLDQTLYIIEGIPDGDYYIAIVGVDAAGNVSDLSELQTATFDDTPPVFTVSYDQPIPVGPGELGITLTVDEALRSSPSLTIQPANFSHPVAVSLEEAGPNTYTGAYAVSSLSGSTGVAEIGVSGRDTFGNSFSGAPEGPELILDVEKPSAAISVGTPEPVQVLPGPVAVTVNVTVNKANLPGPPDLSFAPPTGETVTVDLTGSGADWQGSLELTSAMGTGTGTFVFSATDTLGNSGNTITAGDELEIYNTADAPPPPIPSGVEVVSLKDGEIAVGWDAAEGAEQYNLYRSAGIGSTPSVRVATLTDLSELVLFDTPPADGVYRYAVSSERLGSESSLSLIRTAESDRTPPELPENLSVELNLAGRVEISWEAPSSGETPDRYFLYRNSTEDPLRPYSGPGVAIDSPPRGLIEYRVASVDSFGNENLSAPVSIEMFVGAVSDLRAVLPQGGEAFLQWTPEDDEAAGHNVYADGARLNEGLVSGSFFPLSGLSGDTAVEYAVRAVDAEDRESAPRTITVYPITIDVEANTRADGTSRPLRSRYFDRLEVFANNAAASTWNFDTIAVERSQGGGDPINVEQALDSGEVAGNGTGNWSVIVPGPQNGIEANDFTFELRRAEEDGSVAIHRRNYDTISANRAATEVNVTAQEAPLAGGLNDFTAEFINRGYADMDLLLVRGGGADPGNLVLEVIDGNNAVVNAVPFQTPLSGMRTAPGGLGYFRIAPGESRSVTFTNVLIPEQLGEAGEARIRVRSGEIYYDLGGLDQLSSGPISGSSGISLVETPYYGTLDVESEGIVNDQPFQLSGYARDRQTDAPVANVSLRIGFNLRGYTWWEEVTTDENGRWEFTYTPPTGVSGQYSFWAAHPDVEDVLNQGEATLLQILPNPSRGTVRMSKNDTLDFSFRLVNPGEIPLELDSVSARVFTVEVNEAGDSIETDIDSVSIDAAGILPLALPGSDRQRVELRATSALDAPDFARAEVTFVTTEGATAQIDLELTLLPAVPVLEVEAPSRGFVDRSLDRGNQRSQRVLISNGGLRTLEDVEIVPPQNIPWMQLSLPADADGIIRVPDLAVGDELELTVVYTPPADVELGFYDDVFTVRGSNATADFEVGLFAEITSNLTGSARFTVTNIVEQKVPNASVRLRNGVNRIDLGPFYTDSLGEVFVDELQEGKWSYKITAPGHSATSGTIEIEPDQTLLVEPELNKSLVSVTFEVVPVPFTDRYEIRLEQTFETRVPAPVMVMDPPRYTFENIDPGFETTVIYTLRNEGLISVNDVEIEGEEEGNFTLTPLINFIPELRPDQTVEIPARIRLSPDLAAEGGGLSGQFDSTPGGLVCADPQTLEDFASGVAAIAKLGAEGEYGSASLSELRSALAFAMAAGHAWSAASVAVKNSTGLEVAITAIGSFIGCLSADISGGDPGDGSPGSPGGRGTRPSLDQGTRGCFPAGTPVVLADGSLLPIEELRPGEELRTGERASDVAAVAQVFKLESDALHMLQLSSFDGTRAPRELAVTGPHRLWRDGTGWTHVSHLEVGDLLGAQGGGHWVIESIEDVPGTHEVFNFQLEGVSGFYVDGVLAEDVCGGAFIDLSEAEEVSAR